MNVGTLTQLRDEQTGTPYLKGEICTYSLDLPMKLVATPSRQTEESPTHNVIGKGKHGKEFQAGVAWQGKTKDGDTYYSLSLSIPELKMNDQRFVAFDGRDGTFHVKVSTPEQEKKAA